ncbi:glycosyltransferase family 4 protein [Inhella sp.]|uniref:glycosyltransferase family 4 protein n=1 Tax=Inhella sp. TaxID=1921806 RepID=UPI0035AE5D8E
MRLLIVSQHFWPESFRINEVAAALVAQGVELTVLTGQPNYPEGQVFSGYRAFNWGCERHADGYDIVRVPLSPRGPAGRGAARRLVLNYLSFIASASLFGPWLLRGRRFDTVFVYATSPILQALPALWLGWLQRAAVVTWVQDLWPASLQITGYVRNARLLAAVAAVTRFIYRRNDRLLVQSPAFLPEVRAMAGGTPVAVHENPGDREPAQQVALPEALRPQAGRFNLVFAGNLGTVQALETVLDAAELAGPGLLWWLVGSGARSAWLAEQVAQRGLQDRVRLPGRFEAACMPALFAAADALLVTLNRAPALAQVVPSKMQAYLAAGRPILASLDGEGERVLREADAGLAVPAEDAQQLAAAALRLSAMPAAERERLGGNGRRYFDTHYEPMESARQLLEQLREAVKTLK